MSDHVYVQGRAGQTPSGVAVLEKEFFPIEGIGPIRFNLDQYIGLVKILTRTAAI